ncbi:MAG: dephospho-CoA kinase [Candidatus Omnitrophota bacterium]
MPRQKQENKIVIGLTGSFGSGKSTVAKLFSFYGASVIDADKIARSCLIRGGKVYNKIISAFGDKVLSADKNIDRRALAETVFNDKRLLRRLNRIVHPGVIWIIKSGINSRKKGVIILDAPLLLEAGLKDAVDSLIVVTIDKDKQFSRLAKRAFLRKPDILKRIKSQISQDEKLRFADFIINNSGSLAETRKQVKGIVTKLIPCPAKRLKLGISFSSKKKAN